MSLGVGGARLSSSRRGRLLALRFAGSARRRGEAEATAHRGTRRGGHPRHPGRTPAKTPRPTRSFITRSRRPVPSPPRGQALRSRRPFRAAVSRRDLSRERPGRLASGFRVPLERRRRRTPYRPRGREAKCPIIVWGDLAVPLPVEDWLSRFCPADRPPTVALLEAVAFGASRLRRDVGPIRMPPTGALASLRSTTGRTPRVPRPAPRSWSGEQPPLSVGARPPEESGPRLEVRARRPGPSGPPLGRVPPAGPTHPLGLPIRLRRVPDRLRSPCGDRPRREPIRPERPRECERDIRQRPSYQAAELQARDEIRLGQYGPSLLFVSPDSTAPPRR